MEAERVRERQTYGELRVLNLRPIGDRERYEDSPGFVTRSDDYQR